MTHGCKIFTAQFVCAIIITFGSSSKLREDAQNPGSNYNKPNSNHDSVNLIKENIVKVHPQVNQKVQSLINDKNIVDNNKIHQLSKNNVFRPWSKDRLNLGDINKHNSLKYEQQLGAELVQDNKIPEQKPFIRPVLADTNGGLELKHVESYYKLEDGAPNGVIENVQRGSVETGLNNVPEVLYIGRDGDRHHGNLHKRQAEEQNVDSNPAPKNEPGSTNLKEVADDKESLTMPNGTSLDNGTLANHTEAETEQEQTTSAPPKEKEPELPPPGAAEEEHHSSLTIFFILLVVAIAILLVHLLIQTKFHYLPDSIAIVLIGAFIGLLLKLFKFGNWKNEEAFPPTIFFIVLLPPIIFEGGYNLHKGNFFHNIGSILVFAVFGTVISAVVVGGGVYLLGQAEVAFKLDLVESFAFGSLISAVDPVATLAIFQALDVDPILYMLVFGESMLNDAVSIVLTTTMLEFASPEAVITSGTAAFFQAVGRFCLMFFASAAIGVAFGLVSAMVTKFVDLHKTPSLEVGMVFCFSYLPYALAEGIHLSGIMAILFCGIVMSHYTHLNLSPISQITVQQTFRTIAFIAETCVFAYLGLAIFSFKVNVKPAFTIWSIVLILLGRALNIFPLSFLMNFFREHKITHKNQFIMWFSGLRGAVAFALSLHMELEEEKHYVLVTTTLIMVLFTIVFLGGSTMPLLKFLQLKDKKRKKRKRLDGEVSMSKTKEMGDAIDSEHLSELTEEDETHVIRPHMKGFIKLDARYLIPFFTKRFTQQEVREGRSQVETLTTQWQMEVRAAPSESDDENAEMETSLIPMNNNGSLFSNGMSGPNNRL